MRDDGKGADLFLCEFTSGVVSTYVISMYEHAVSDPERGRLHAILVGVLLHGVLHVLHVIAEELVYFIEVHGKVLGAQIGNLGIWVDGDQWVIAVSCKERGYTRGGMRGVIVSELC